MGPIGKVLYWAIELLRKRLNVEDLIRKALEKINKKLNMASDEVDKSVKKSMIILVDFTTLCARTIY